MGVQIREAIPDDVEAIDAFDVFPGERKPEVEAGEIIVAVADDKVVGYLKHNKKFFGRPFVWYVCVNKNYRRMGATKMLFARTEEIYKGHPLLFSSTEDDNTEMLNFFEKYGYKKSGNIENLQPQVEVIFVKDLKV
jgi:ribosomal protein S18 acetylase RimI-like enzyme